MKISNFRNAWVFSSFTVLACTPEKPKDSDDLPPVPNQDAQWYEIARTPEIVALLDTARIERTPEGTARIWFRFVYDAPTTLGDDTTVKYSAMEAREEIDCVNRRTKDLEMRMETTTGMSTGSPFPTPAWQSIDTHPMNSGIFLVACRTLGTPIPAQPGL